MMRITNAALVLLFSVALAHLAGCAGGVPAGTQEQELPAWVRIVVPEMDGRLYFVGGTSFAVDEEAGVRAAGADARSQIHLRATHDFTEIFNRAIRESGVETTPMERRSIKNSITGFYGDRMSDIAVEEDVYHRLCEEAPRTEPAEDDGAEGPVCQVFVRLSVERAAWDGGLVELLVTERQRRIDEGEEHLADHVEWMIRQITDEEPVGMREQQR